MRSRPNQCSSAKRIRLAGALGATMMAASLLLGCEGQEIEYNYPTSGPGGKPTYKKEEGLFGSDGLKLFGDSKPEEGAAGSGIAVNSFLWRASLDTVSFMPLASADPFGGVIITDWYSPPDAQEERFKVNVFILDRALRSDGVRAKVFKQLRSGESWSDAEVDPALHIQLENAILTRARQLRINSASR